MSPLRRDASRLRRELSLLLRRAAHWIDSEPLYTVEVVAADVAYTFIDCRRKLSE